MTIQSPGQGTGAAAVTIGLLGARGRMGQALIEAIAATSGARLAGGVERPGHPDIGQLLAPGIVLGDDPAVLATDADVLIDFTTPAALPAHLAVCRVAGCALVVGTTGLDAAQHSALDAAAKHTALLQAANMSLGVAVLSALVAQAAAQLAAWDIEIVEMHHAAKRDAPSGTALLLGAAAAHGRGMQLDAVRSPARDGITDERAPGSIGFASLRGGTVAGDHQVILAGPHERLELSHRAENRSIFARGAVHAAVWLASQPPGRYALADLLKP